MPTPLRTVVLWLGSALLSAGVFLLIGNALAPILGDSRAWMAYAALAAGALLLGAGYWIERAPATSSTADGSVQAFLARVLTTSGVLWIVGSGLCAVFFVGVAITNPDARRDVGGAVVEVAFFVAGVSAIIGFVLWLIGRLLRR